MDPFKNFSYGTVLTAPSPATSGTSIVLQSGEGANFAAGTQGVLYPAGSNPLASNAEIVRITAVSTDTLTITRAQESTTAKTVATGWQVHSGITKRFTDSITKERVTVGAEDADYMTDASNDTAQIQAAINAVAAAGGGEIYIKPGIYWITSTISFPMDAKVRLTGAKWSKATGVAGGTCLLAAVAMTDMINITGASSVTLNSDLSHDNHFEHIIFSGGSGNATNIFKLKNTDLVKFESCYIVAGVNGVVTEYVGVDPLTDASIPGGLLMNNCIVANTGRNLDMQYQGQCWITNGWFDSSSGSAVTSHIRLKSCVKVHIINCEINMATAGIEFEDTATAPCQLITIGGCTFTVGVGNKLWSVGTQNSATSGKINIYGGSWDGAGTYDQLWNEEQPQAFIGLNRDRLYARGNITGATTFNREDGHTHTATLTGDVTATVTNGKTKGDTLTFVFTQDATGSRIVTWPSTVKSAPKLSTAPSSINTLVFVWDGTNWNGYTSPISAEVTTVASSATPTPTGGSLDNELYVTALATNATIAAPTGTPANGNKLVIRIKDNGTARTLAYNAIYRAMGLTLPTTTTISKTIYLGAKYNATDSKWDIIAYSQEA